MRRIEYLWILAAMICGMAFMLIGGILTDRAADSYAAFKENQGASCIVIDAGHGGVDGGAVSCTGIYESMINLEIALRLNDLLQLLGYQTYMIRTEDISVYTSGSTIAEKKISDLKERVRIIQSVDAPIVVSIHQNYFADGRYSGAQVFFNEKGEGLAKLTQDLFVKNLNPGSHRKTKRANGVYLMDKIQCPAILVECGFLSNATEEYNLRDSAYQKKICCVISGAISKYINNSSVA